MNTRKIVIGAVVVVIGLPVVSVLIAGVSFYALNRTNGTIISSGQKREYLLYVPRSYDRAKPAPRHQHARRGAVAGRTNGNKSMEQGGR
jgi:poly(3-hydroxybutyrate) depolymerase